MAGRQLSADDWRAVFHRLAEVVPHDRTWRVTVIGGLAMALGYGARRTTEDADVVDTAPEVLEAAKALAPEFGLASTWMNAKAEEAGYVLAAVTTDTRVVFQEPSLEVRVPSIAHMLAMKVARFAGDIDIDDAKLLLSKLGAFRDADEVWTHIGGLVPVAGRPQARHNLENLWELVHEPA
jgi:hypothetical protein